jgi:hypothetical protein
MDTYGMTPEEMSRRQRLIDNLIANGSLDLAADVAKGPYRINGNPGGTPQGPSQSPPNSADMMRSPTITSATPMGSAWNPANQPAGGAPPQQGPTQASGAPATGNPRYDFPQNATGQPTININVTGTIPSDYNYATRTPASAPPNAAGFSRQGYGEEPTNWSEGAAPGTPAGFSRQGYPQGPSQPVAMPSFASQSGNPYEWDTYGETGAMGVWPGYTEQQAQKDYFVNQQLGRSQGPSQQLGMPSFNNPGQQLQDLGNMYQEWMRSQLLPPGTPPAVPEWQQQYPMGRTDHAPSAMNNPMYPYSPQWAGR